MTRLSRFALSLAAVASLAALFAPVASSWPGANGAIVFAASGSSLDSGIRIAPLGAERSQITRLTSDPADSEPQVSPDGRQVVFVRSSDPEAFGDDTPATIYLINVDGSGLRPVTDGLHPDEEPAFSASGSRIYFTRLDSGYGDVFSIRLDGGGLRQITTGSGTDHHPRAASRGGLLTFERWGRYHHIFVSRADGSRIRDLTPKLKKPLAAADPEFSPDGRRVVYSTSDRLISVGVNGARPRLLLRPRAGFDRYYADPTFAPDGRSLLFSTVDPETGRSSLRRLDSRRLRRLPNPLVEPHLSASNPAWLVRR